MNPATTLCYEIDSQTNCTCAGINYVDEKDFKEYLTTRIRKKFFDIKGTEELFDNFESVASTDFEKGVLLKTLKSQNDPDDGWMVGEAVAQCFLEDEKGARFHYESTRDAKNPRASLPGADLVGFSGSPESTVFLFGEVKTTSPSDKESPPQIFNGRTGMRKQLEGLKTIPEKRAALVRWLGFKVIASTNSQFLADYKKALKAYLSSNTERVRLAGVLVRDVSPQRSDLEGRYDALSKNLCSEMTIALFCLYLPISIDELPTLMGPKS